MKKIIALSILALGFTTYANAQATASADASATIIAPITISMNTPMNFGNIAINASAGTVVMDYAGARTPNGGVTLPANAGNPTAAEFLVSGEDGFTYDILLPTSAIQIVDVNSANPMNVDNFTSDPIGSGILTGGSQLVHVGAKIHVNGSQPAGVYTSATPFDVTVNYN